LDGRCGQPDEAIGPYERLRVCNRRIASSDVDAVRVARLGEIRSVVEDEERAVLFARRPERRGRLDQPLVVELLVAELDDVDAAAQRGVEQRTRVVPVRPRLENEVEPRAREAS